MANVDSKKQVTESIRTSKRLFIVNMLLKYTINEELIIENESSNMAPRRIEFIK
jgi:hypothetical protein